MADLPRWRRWRRWFWAQVARGALAAADRWPRRWHRLGCRVLVRLAPWIRPGAVHQARANLALAFPDATPGRRRAMERGMLAALARNLDAALTARREAAAGFPGIAERSGEDQDLPAALERELAAGRGAFLLTAHLGCWELLGTYLARRLGGLAVVTATVRNPAVDRLLQERRRAVGMTPLPREEGARPILRELAANRTVGVLLDQATRAESVDVPFFGHDAPTPVGMARIARRREVPIVPAALVWERGAWRTHVLAPLRPQEFASDRALTAACSRALEELVARNPEQWVWFHRRWP
jgi:KDO2-lipid IV(A) lauroyltransferase